MSATEKHEPPKQADTQADDSDSKQRPITSSSSNDQRMRRQHLAVQIPSSLVLGLDLPVEKIRAISQDVGLPANGIVFVLEALHRADILEAESDVTRSVIKSARERFPNSAKKALEKWQILNRKDIGRIVFALADHELVRKAGNISIDDFERPFTLGDVVGPS